MRKVISIPMTLVLFMMIALVSTRSAQAGWQSDWERVRAGAKKEGKLVVAIPPSAELRKQLEVIFKQELGIEIELVLARGRKAARRIADEYKSGIRYFDAVISSYSTASSRLLPM